jgi:UDP-N-acetyl-D-mannosaminuronate dehydrogenase
MKNSRVLIIGVTYKPDIADQRESPAEPLAIQLAEMGASLTYFDPFVDAWDVHGLNVGRQTDLSEALTTCDIALLIQNHSTLDLEFIANHAPLILDTRGKLDGPNVERL